MAIPKIREQIEARVKDTGDIMTGLLTLSGNPTADFHAATKKYVDDNTPDVANAALKLTTNAGSSTLPVYFADGIPKQCNTSLGVSITGNAATATKATQDGNGNVITSTYLPLSGGTLTGNIEINKPSYPMIMIKDSGQGRRGEFIYNINEEVIISNYKDENNRSLLFLRNENNINNLLQLSRVVNGQWNNYNIYGEHNKPTAADIGAATSGHTHSNIVTAGDNRSVATVPSDYKNSLIFQGLKYNTTITLPSSASTTYSYLVGLRGWSDNSGGKAHELAFNNDGLFIRDGETDSWGGWRRVYDSSHKPTPADIGAPTTTGSGASGTWGISIGGNAKGISSSGYGNGNLTYLQTSGDFNGATGWSHYLIANHGDGATYYNYTLALPFWSPPKYKRQTGNTSNVTSWYTIYSTENITCGTSGSPANNGDIFIKY